MGSVIQLEAWSHPSSWGPLVPPIVGLQQIAVSAVPTQLADNPCAGMRPIKNKSPMKVGEKKRSGVGVSLGKVLIWGGIFCTGGRLSSGTQQTVHKGQGPSSTSFSVLDNSRFHLYKVQLSGGALTFQA